MADKQKKAWWQSKTIWINAITAATATLTVLGGQQIVTDHPAIAAGLVADKPPVVALKATQPGHKGPQ